MREALLIARREIVDTVRTRAFWLGVLLFPMIWVLAIRLPVWLGEKSMRSRAFVIWDPAGEFGLAASNAVVRGRVEAERTSLADYAARYAPNAKLPGDAEAFQAAGGWRGTLQRLAPNLRSNAPAFEPPPPRFVQIPLPIPAGATSDIATIAAGLQPWLRGERKVGLDGRNVDLFAAILIPPGFAAGGFARQPGSTNSAPFQFWSANLADPALQQLVESALSAELRRRAFRAEGIDPATARKIESVQAPVANFDPRKENGHAEVGVADRANQWLPSVMVYVLWVAVFSVGQMLMNSVVEEKSSRVVEILLSSVRPATLMAGKLLGIAVVGLLMLGSWLLTAALGGWWAVRSAPPAGSAGGGGGGEVVAQIIHGLDFSALLPGMVLYFVLGYLVYGAFFLAVGAACNSVKEVQAMVSLVMPVLLLPLFMLPFIPRDPNGPLAVALSWIPPFTPFVMLNRLAAHPPLRDTLGAPVMLVAFIVFEVWAAGRIFRRALLRTGEAPRWSDMWRMFRGD